MGFRRSPERNVLGESICQEPWVSLNIPSGCNKNTRPWLFLCKHFSGLYVQQATLRGEILFSHRKRDFLLFTVKKVNLPSSPISLLYCNPLHVQAPIVDPLPHSCGSWATSGTAGNVKLLLLLLSWIMKTVVSHLSVLCLLQHPWNTNKLTC